MSIRPKSQDECQRAAREASSPSGPLPIIDEKQTPLDSWSPQPMARTFPMAQISPTVSMLLGLPEMTMLESRLTESALVATGLNVGHVSPGAG